MTATAKSGRPGHAWATASLALSICGSAALLIAPVSVTGGSESATQTDSGVVVESSSQTNNETLLQGGDAAAVLVLLAAPILISAIPALTRRWERATRVVACILLTLILPIGYFTIGGFYLPSVIAMLIAAIRARPAPEPPSGLHSRVAAQ